MPDLWVIVLLPLHVLELFEERLQCTVDGRYVSCLEQAVNWELAEHLIEAIRGL